MTQFTKLFKKYASGLLLVLLLLSPLQSSAALLASDVAILEQQAALLTQAVDSSTSITEAKKTELKALIAQIEDIIVVLSAQVAVDPSAVSQRRMNIENVIVTGDAKDFDSKVLVVWGPETVGATTYDRSTSTYNYEFVTTLAQNQKIERLEKLSELTFSQLAAEVGFSAGQLKKAATISFKRFDNARDVQDNYSAPIAGEGLEMYFGTYSIINNVYVTSGKDIFSLTAETDQDETITLAVTPRFYSCGRDRTCRSSGNAYFVSYALYDNVQATLTDNNANREGVKEVLSYTFENVGAQFGVSDEVLIDELLALMLNHTVYYETESSRGPASVGACHSAKIQNVLSETMYHFIQNFQYDGGADSIAVGAPIKVVSATPRDPARGCMDVDNTFFSALP